MTVDEALVMVRRYGAAIYHDRVADAAQYGGDLIDALTGSKTREWTRPTSPVGVEAVRDVDGQIWRPHPNQGSPLFHDRWVCDDPKVHVMYTWLQLLECAPLTMVVDCG